MEEIVAGNTIPLDIQTSLDTGGPFDLTGCKVTFGLARTRDDAPLVTKANDAAGGDATQITVTDATGGALTVYLRRADTLRLAGKYVWDVMATTAGGDRYTIATGELTFVRSVAPEAP